MLNVWGAVLRSPLPCLCELGYVIASLCTSVPIHEMGYPFKSWQTWNVCEMLSLAWCVPTARTGLLDCQPLLWISSPPVNRIPPVVGAWTFISNPSPIRRVNFGSVYLLHLGSLWLSPLLVKESQLCVRWIIVPQSQGGALCHPTCGPGEEKPSYISRHGTSFMRV